MSPARNIELKARVADLCAARTIAERVATSRLGVQRQRDTYFRCANGRLKLRDIEGRSAQLIAYHRPAQSGAKASDYQLLELPDRGMASQLREILTAVLGTTVIVEKTREIFLYKTARIHLDEVADLGTFLEFEAAVSGDTDDAAANEQVGWLQKQFQLAHADLMSGSYGDMLLKGAADY
jgi:predicted adenylyl cyclase CyaB